MSKAKFESVFPRISEELVQLLRDEGLPKDAVQWFADSLQYNCVGGKLNRGVSVVDTYVLLTGKKELSEEEYYRLALLGWLIELLQAFFLVSDDIMDESKTRRGQPCWYLKPKVGMIAINDAFMLESGIYILLKKHFRQEKYYVDLLELFHDISFKTELGQLVDLLTAPEDEVDLDRFSLDKHSFIVRYKTAYYSFYLPVVLAMYVAGITDPKDMQQALDVLIPLGEYFQVQDDYLDNFGDPEFIGKIGTDIQDNKCSWLVNKALQKATPEQRKVLEDNYGVKDKAKEVVVKQLYDEMKIEQDYLDYEEEVVGEIKKKIAEVDESRGFKKAVLEAFLAKIYKRQK
ncbi:Farnesyl pyrophosphate synthase [Yarrowia sp. B02]|nr:Farnesyl pyrophosphate synthase [Yarrowia sp. B02]